MGKNQFKGKAHKERAQPKARKHLGILERHKDYVLRAKDFNRKKAQIKKLRKLAQDRNPDEFSYSMQHTHVDKKTGHRVRDQAKVAEERQHTAEELRLMETQDISYLNMRRKMDIGRVEKLKALIHGTDAPISARHTLFQEESGEKDQNEEETEETEEEKLAKRLDTAPELVFERVRPTIRQLKEEKLVVGGDATAGERMKAKRESLRREIKEREKRAEKMTVLAREMEIKKLLAGPGRKFKRFNPETGTVQFIWRQERKR